MRGGNPPLLCRWLLAALPDFQPRPGKKEFYHALFDRLFSFGV